MGSRLSLTMDDDLEEIIRKMATDEFRTVNQQLRHLIKLGLKYQGKEIKGTATIPKGWQIVVGEHR